MSIENFIPVNILCQHYNIEQSFFGNLSQIGLVEIHIVEKIPYIHKDAIYEIEKIIRMHQELEVNLEGIDIVFNLLQKIEALQTELTTVRNRLLLYEN